MLGVGVVAEMFPEFGLARVWTYTGTENVPVLVGMVAGGDVTNWSLVPETNDGPEPKKELSELGAPPTSSHSRPRTSKPTPVRVTTVPPFSFEYDLPLAATSAVSPVMCGAGM